MKKGLRIQEKHQKAVSKLKGAAQIMSPELPQKPKLKNLAGLSKKSVAHTLGKMEEAKEKLKKAKNRADRKALNKKVIKGVERRVKGKKAREAANAANVAAKSVETTLKAEHKAKNFVKHQLISANAKYQQANAHALQKKLKEHKLLKLEAKNAMAKSIINRSIEEKAIKSSAKKAQLKSQNEILNKVVKHGLKEKTELYNSIANSLGKKVMGNLDVIYEHDEKEISKILTAYRANMMKHDQEMFKETKDLKDSGELTSAQYKKLRTYGEEYSDLIKSLKGADDQLNIWKQEAADTHEMNKEYLDWSIGIHQYINQTVTAALQKKYQNWLQMEQAQWKTEEGVMIEGMEIGARLASYMRVGFL